MSIADELRQIATQLDLWGHDELNRAMAVQALVELADRLDADDE